jgi:pre-mRNA-processing factor SLU7
MTHKKQDCLERPRKKGAKYTNKDIKADEIIHEVAAGFDAKRDRWNGYDPAEHKRIYEEYEAIEAARQKLREEEIDNQTTTDLAAVRKVAKAGKKEGKEADPDFGSSDEEDADDDKYADAADAVGQKLDTKTRITVRNLRIREDTAKYLMNLDPESAYYDPKTRSMRDAPMKNVPPEDVCSRFTRIDLILNDYDRRNLLATTSFASPAKLLKFKNCSYSRGKPQLEAMMSISMLIPPKDNFFILNSRRRRN